MRIVIAGAGPGGLFAAVVLAAHGHEVEVFEQSDEIRTSGAGIQVSPNGTKLFARYNVLEALEAVAFEPEAATLRRADTGATVFSTPLGSTALNRYDAPYLHLHRGDLTSVLCNAARARGVTVQTAKRLTAFSNDDNQVAVQCADGSTGTCDILVGADGIHSSVRAQMCGNDSARFTNHVAWRGLVPSDQVPSGLIAPHATVWSGPGRHFVHYFVRGGSLINFVAIKEHDIWTDEKWELPGNLEEVRASFKDWSSGISALLQAAETTHLWGLFDRPPLEQWTEGRVGLLGDACHPMLPFMAQGAVMAFEDAVVLARAIDTIPDPAKALAAYERIRKPRTTAVQERARRNGKLFHLRGRVPREISFTPMAIIHRLAPGVIARQLDWIYGYDASAVDVERIG